MEILSILCCFLLGVFFYLTGILFSKYEEKSWSKLSPYECGFSSFSSPSLPLSSGFFVVALLFLIFDVELTLVFAMVVGFSCCLDWLVVSNVFVFGLVVGVFYEWWYNSVDWFI